MRSWTRARFTFFAFLGPSLFWLIAFFVIPMLLLWVISFSTNFDPQTISLKWTGTNYARILNPVYLQVFWHSFWIALLTTFITLILALPIAMAIAFSNPFWRPWLLFMVILPFWTSMLMRTYALIIVLRTHGLINLFLGKLFSLLHIPFAPLNLLYTQGAVILGLVYMSLPFMVLPLYVQIEKIDTSYLEASSDLGAGYVHTFLKIILPTIMPGIISGFVLTFIPNLGAYLVPDLLGGVGGFMISNAIVAQFERVNDWPFGSALSFTLLYATVAVIFARSVLLRFIQRSA